MDSTILVIDDDTDIHRLLDAGLGSQALRFIFATNADDGFMLARTAQPDLVLLDVELPGTSGFEVCARLEACPETWTIPVVFLTAVTDVATKVRAFECGAVDYVTKPFEPAELRARVRNALHTKRCEDLLATQVRIDALTGLWSRTHFESRVAEEISACRRFGHDTAVVLLDIDEFERFDRRHGEPLGERVLQRFGRCLEGCVRKTDTLCRYGGAQFGIMLRQTAMAGAAAYARRLHRHIDALRLGDDGLMRGITTSAGVAATDLWSKDEALDDARLLARADFALHLARHAGRNRVELATAA